MQRVRTIHKHFPLKAISTFGTNNDQYFIKSQGQNWIQVHNNSQLKDVISLPHSLRMFRLENCLPPQHTNVDQTQFLFTNANSVCIGSPNSIGTETFTRMIDLTVSEEMSNSVSIGISKYCNISQNSQNKAQINILQNRRQSFFHSKYDIDLRVVKNSKIAYNKNYIYFASYNNSQRMFSYNLQLQVVVPLFHLPEIAKENFVKEPFFLPSSEHHCKINDDIMFIYATNWIAMGDIRMKRFVAISELLHCQSAFSVNNHGVPQVYFTQENLLREYDFRKNTNKEKPVLAHQHPIINSYPIMNQLIGVQSNSFSGVSLYSPVVCQI